MNFSRDSLWETSSSSKFNVCADFCIQKSTKKVMSYEKSGIVRPDERSVKLFFLVFGSLQTQDFLEGLCEPKTKKNSFTEFSKNAGS